MTEPEKIISRFLAIVLFYAGVSLIYFSLVGKPLFDATVESYSVYIFIIGFVSILWTIPELLSEFSFFRRFIRKKETKDSKEAKKKK